ncbi:acyl-CoA thioesterase [Limnoglobus roseus]|uniref:Acyl-CoA thioesterase n=1 Tax=Limnoglobus roseus TaxID=2598579 RepID=A0A5C1AIL6_9BACT|nr:thioesterase family protein [Limnoglobus roseus]QEL16964.1 acyl-CoA thioesterase [Limnoglobus roseus]
MSQPFTITRRVEFGDTDMAGIMHFSNFFRFMEVAETAFLRSHGLTVSWTEGGQSYGFPRVSTACDFQRPLRFEDEVTIAVSVEKIGKKSISYKFTFTLAGQPIAEGLMSSVYCRKSGGVLESLDIPPDLRAKLEA